VIIGLDVGTTVIKAVALAEDGTQVRRAAATVPLQRPGPGRYEQDVPAVFAAVESVLADLARCRPVEAIGVTGQGDGVWLADAQGVPTRPAISWLDARASDILADWAADGRLAAIFKRTGSLLFPGSAAPILAALAAEEPAARDAAATAG
jgi:sugar (pentulose or hexulose) kinase